MAKARDVAQYVLEQAPGGRLSTVKLQKLVYYCQAWHLAWEGKPLFDEEIQAAGIGPVVPALKPLLEGKDEADASCGIGDSSKVTAAERENIDATLPAYIGRKPFWLVELSYLERPWREARGDVPPGNVCENVISQASMAEYYSSLLPCGKTREECPAASSGACACGGGGGRRKKKSSGRRRRGGACAR